MSDLVERITEAMVKQHPFNGGDYPAWFQEWIDKAAPAVAAYVRENFTDHAEELGLKVEHVRGLTAADKHLRRYRRFASEWVPDE